MNLLETCRLVLLNLIENKFKVFLTSLGILVGTITIVLVIAIGKGGEAKVADQFKDLSAETVYVNLNYKRLENKETSQIEKLNMNIVEQIKEESTTLEDLYLSASSYMEVKLGNEKVYTSITGVSDGFDKVSNLEIDEGLQLDEEDQEYENNVAVIGKNIVEKYYGSSENAINQAIQIGNNSYKIIGTLKGKGDGLQGLNPDDTIFLPYSVANKFMDTNTIPKIVGLSDDLKHVELTKKEIMSTLDYLLEDSSVYVIDDAGSRIEAALSSAKTMNLLLLSVGTIVFIVGGIGIMNVLFLSVKERTKEIGILKALGIGNNEVLIQFVLESAIISSLGGVAGIIISSAIMPLMRYTEIAVVDSIEGKIIAFCFAMITGMLFGIYPAYKASMLKPVDALSIE